MKSILHRDFVYKDSAHTDVAATIRKERKRLRELEEREARDELEAQHKVSPMKAKEK